MKKLGDDIAIIISRFMATWTFIFILALFLGCCLFYVHIESNKPLDIFNLGVSLYTLFIDIIILKSAISLRDMDRAKMDSLHRKDSQILKEIKKK